MIQFKNDSITIFQSALFKTTTTVVHTDDLILVVDPTWLPHEIRSIREYVSKIQGNRPLYLLFTHGDFDHIIGYRAFPQAITIGSTGLKEHPDKQKKIELIKEFDSKNYIDRDYEIVFPTLDHVIERNGEQLKIGDTTLNFYLAHGHTHDSLFTVVEPLDVFITGDYLSDFELPFVYYSGKHYNDTLLQAKRILDTFNIHILVPGHGQTTTDREEMYRRINLSQDFLDRLTEAVKCNNQFLIDKLANEYPYPSSFTKECHEKNVALIREELRNIK